MADEIDELKKLPPEERLRRLKEYSKIREKEIKEAQKLLKKDEDELTKRKEFEQKIPIPQLTTDGGETLTTAEERDMFDVHRFKGVRQDEDTVVKTVDTLEETVEQEPIRKEFIDTAQYTQALAEASIRPIHEFYTELTQINQTAVHTGYLTREQLDRVMYIDTITERKKEANYTPTKSAEKEMSLVHKISERLMGMYKSQGNNTETQKHGYTFDSEQQYTP